MSLEFFEQPFASMTQARYLRLSTVRGAYFLGRINIPQAKEMLCGELIVGKPETFFDDSELLGATQDEILDALVPDTGLED